MSLRKTPTSSLSGSHSIHASPLHLTMCDRYSNRVARQASLVPNPSQNLENMARGSFSRDPYGIFVPCHQASPGNHQYHYRLSYLRYTHPPCMHPDMLLLVYRRRSSSPLHPHNRNTLFGPKVLVAQSPVAHAHTRLAPFGQEVTSR